MMLEGRPFAGRELEQLKRFLAEMDLEYDEGIEYSVCIPDEDGNIIATGSVDSHVLKCIAIAPSCQGQGLSGTILSQLIQYQFEQGRSHILMYTKPKNQEMFEDLGFHTIIRTEEVLLMENRVHGFDRFLDQLQKETVRVAGEDLLNPSGQKADAPVIGAIVANCNPFTLGHRYLIRKALEQCDWLHLFVLSDDRTCFSAEDRYEMVKAGIADLDRVILHRTSQYMISAATFPTYFMKEKVQARKANCRLDLELFSGRIAPALGITKRFVGTEPNCQVTDCYNETMKEILPRAGIRVIEIPRKEADGAVISASAVRTVLKDGADMETLRTMVPESTYTYLSRIISRL